MRQNPAKQAPGGTSKAKLGPKPQADLKSAPEARNEKSSKKASETTKIKRKK